MNQNLHLKLTQVLHWLLNHMWKDKQQMEAARTKQRLWLVTAAGERAGRVQISAY